MTAIGDLAKLFWQAFRHFNDDDGSAMAGFIAFSALLSMFPFLIFATTMVGVLVGETQSEQTIDALFRIAPEHVALTVEPVVSEVLSHKSSQVLTVSAVFAIWVASNAVEAVRVGFDRAYDVHRSRNFLINRAKAITLVFVGAFVAALLGFSILLSPLIISQAQAIAGVQIPYVAGYLTYGFGVIVFMIFAYILHWTLPGRPMKIIRIWPGVFVTTLFWVIAASAFSTYLRFAPSYTVTYGTLAGVIITLMFFYITGATVLFGAEFNAALARTTGRGAVPSNQG